MVYVRNEYILVVRRVKKYNDFEGVNYEKWNICKPAREMGAKLNIPDTGF